MATFQEILQEIETHPKEQKGISKEDIDSIPSQDRNAVVALFMSRLEEGDVNYDQQLQWLLGDKYVMGLETRLKALPENAHGKTFLPFFLYKHTGNRHYLDKMISAVIHAEPEWSARKSALASASYLRGEIGKSPLFWDLCRYLILNDKSISMRKYAMLWLAYEKAYSVEGTGLKPELADCVDRLYESQGKDLPALAILDQIHRNTGSFKP